MDFKIVVYCLVLVLLVDNSSAFQPILPEPDPWFNEYLVFDQPSIPQGVSIDESPRLSWDYNQPEMNVTYTISNSGQKPFYFVDIYDSEELFYEIYANSGLVYPYNPLYQIAGGKTYYWTPDFDGSGSRWQEYGNNVTDSGLNIYYEGGSRNIRQDNRPHAVSIPSPHNFAIQGFYQGTPHNLTGKVVYKLNGNYNPDAGKRSGGQYPDYHQTAPGWAYILAPAGLIALLIGAVFLLRKIHR
ncbi:hypothetical protein HYY74_06990 [Candidatus Woesearchaeota archaeon]|nr:hypothetical protein [Candidatus Woesearchaeota archaeon]